MPTSSCWSSPGQRTELSPLWWHPDYPYCLVSKELRGIIRSLLAKASGVLELFFDHCIYTMLQELDKSPGQHPGAPCPPHSVCSSLPLWEVSVMPPWRPWLSRICPISVPGESLHGYRICIQALLLDRPRIATTNLGKVSWAQLGLWVL